MNAWLKRLALSFIVTFGFVADRAPAQAPLVPATQQFDTSPSSPLASLLSRPILDPNGPPSATPFMNKHGYCCDSDLNWYGCPGIKSNLIFTFGSSRSFFNEPCVPMPAHPMHLKTGHYQSRE